MQCKNPFFGVLHLGSYMAQPAQAAVHSFSAESKCCLCCCPALTLPKHHEGEFSLDFNPSAMKTINVQRKPPPLLKECLPINKTGKGLHSVGQ